MNISECIAKMRRFPDIFRLFPQQTADVAEYFATHFGATALPDDFVQFMTAVDGLKLTKIEIFAIHADLPIPVQTFDTSADPASARDFWDSVGAKNTDNLLIFATDGKGGRYAFDKTSDDTRVFHFLAHSSMRYAIYASFSDWLSDVIERELDVFI